jgi:hypothetical protein
VEIVKTNTATGLEVGSLECGSYDSNAQSRFLLMRHECGATHVLQVLPMWSEKFDHYCTRSCSGETPEKYSVILASIILMF